MSPSSGLLQKSVNNVVSKNKQVSQRGQGSIDRQGNPLWSTQDNATPWSSGGYSILPPIESTGEPAGKGRPNSGFSAFDKSQIGSFEPQSPSELFTGESRAESLPEPNRDNLSKETTRTGKSTPTEWDQFDYYNDNGSITVAPDNWTDWATTPWTPSWATVRPQNSISKDPRMTIGGESYLLNQDEYGNWDIDQSDALRLQQNGYTKTSVPSEENPRLIENQIFADQSTDPNSRAIRWVGGDYIVNPTQYERDAYDYIMSEEFQNFMRDEMGRPDFGADMTALQYDPTLRPAWEKLHTDLHNKGYYNSDFNNRYWQNEDGSFNYKAYWDWIDRNANIYDYLLGQASQEGGDWLTSGGLVANQGLANYATDLYRSYANGEEGAQNIRFGLDPSFLTDEQEQEYLDQMAAGTLGLNADGTFSLEGSNFGLGTDDAGNWWVTMNPKLVSDEDFQDYVLGNIIKDALTNEALDEYNSAYIPTAYDLNQMAGILGPDQTDLYWDINGGYVGEDFNPIEYYGGEAEQYRNFFAPSYEDWLTQMNAGTLGFNLGATGYARNPNIRKMYQNIY